MQSAARPPIPRRHSGPARTVWAPACLVAILGSFLLAGCKGAPERTSPQFDLETFAPVSAQPLSFDLNIPTAEFGLDFGTPPDGFAQKTFYLPAGRGTHYKLALEDFFTSPGLKIMVVDKYLANPKRPDKGLDLMLVRAEVDRLEEIESFLTTIDSRVPQVEVEAKIVEIVLSEDHQIGATTTITETPANANTLFEVGSSKFNTRDFVESLTAPNPAGFQGGLLNMGTIHDEQLFNIVIEALARNENTEIISTPKLTVMSGMTGLITTGQETPIQTARITNGITTIDTTFKKTGIILEVTPLVVGDEVHLTVRPEVSVVSGFTEPTTNNGIATPIITTRNAETTVVLKNRSTLVLGGLVSNQETESESRVPILGSIPFIKYLFSTRNKGKTRTELRFYIKVNITNSSGNSLLSDPARPDF